MPKALLESPALRRGKTRPALRTAGFEDYAQIAALQAANGLSTKSLEEWTHLWVGNPAYQTLPDWPIGWVLEDQSRRIVGVLENIPCYYRKGGETYVAAFGRGCAVEPAFRAFSLMLFVRQRQQPSVDLLMTSTANPTTANILTNTGWSRVPVGAWDQSAFWIASYAKAVPRYLKTKAPGLISTLGAPLLYPPLALTDLLSSGWYRRNARFDLTWMTSYDDRFDTFWMELERQNPGVLLSVRSRETLDWHFRYAMEQKRLWIVVAREGSRVLGYAVFERRDPSSLDLKRALLIDLQTLSPDPALPRTFLAAALERCRREGVHILENVGCWLEAKHARSGPRPYYRNLGHWCYFFYSRHSELSQSLASPDCWGPTQFDTDASL